jgi:Cdc6-like AAA superfamily ATPase
MIVKTTQILPLALMAIDIAAGVVYACHGDVRRAIYWLAAATLTATVTF